MRCDNNLLQQLSRRRRDDLSCSFRFSFSFVYSLPATADILRRALQLTSTTEALGETGDTAENEAQDDNRISTKAFRP